ncbi:MAG: hypothetical protein RLZZ592_2916 [Pseudomonadota bacterium]|jgi:pimeloyl-ACP methyl ester carboxylesterase
MTPTDPTTRQTLTVRVDDTDVRLHVAGQRRPGQRPLMLVHGSTGSTDSHYGYLFPMLAFDRQVVSVDLAAPAGDAPLVLEQLERQVLAAIEAACGDQTVDLMGYSLGAVLAADLAARHPARVGSLVLVAGWMQTDGHQRLRNRIWHELRAARAESLPAYMMFCAFSPAFIRLRTEAELAQMAARIPLDGFVDRQMALNAAIDIRERIGDIRATTLVVGCTHDQMVPPEHARLLFGGIDDARYTQIDAGHAVVFERPAELLCQVSRFLDAPQRHPAGSVIEPDRP